MFGMPYGMYGGFGGYDLMGPMMGMGGMGGIGGMGGMGGLGMGINGIASAATGLLPFIGIYAAIKAYTTPRRPEYDLINVGGKTLMYSNGNISNLSEYAGRFSANSNVVLPSAGNVNNGLGQNLNVSDGVYLNPPPKKTSWFSKF